MAEVNFNFLRPINGTATKTFHRTESGWELKSGYKSGKFFKGYEIPINNLSEAFDVLEENQNAPVFMIHGAIIDGTDLSKMVRRKRSDHEDGLPPTIADRNLSLFCFDIDGYTFTKEEREEIKTWSDEPACFIRNHLPAPFRDASFIYQFSSSYWITSQEFKCHLFFWLKEPVFINNIREWIKQYNKEKGWGNIIDYSVLNAAQPVYIQKRICEGGDDPIPDDSFIGFVDKGADLDWVPDISNVTGEKITGGVKNRNYDLAAGVEKILTSENYHNELNSLALSLMNQKVPPSTVQKMLEGAMNAAKKGLTDPGRLKEWQVRFDDIGRSVESARVIANNMTLDEVLEWIANSSIEEIKLDFAAKVLALDSVDREIAVEEIVEKTRFSKRAVKATIKQLAQERAEEQQSRIREEKKLEREAQGIHEIIPRFTYEFNSVDQAGKILGQSDKSPQIFTMGKSLVSVQKETPQTIRQCKQEHDLGIDYPKVPIIKRYSAPYATLRQRMSKDIVFVDDNGKEIEPSRMFLDAVSEEYNKHYRVLTGIAVAPFVNFNWRVNCKNGYNPETGIVTDIHHKLKLTKMDPDDAYQYLACELFDEFPFSTELDCVLAISALMTACQRPILAADNGFPGYGIVSPTQSSGKTTLAQVISHSVFNCPVAATNFTDDEVELQKHILSILQEGHSCVLFDNIEQGAEVKSNVLARAMTSEVFSGRQLGENKSVNVPSNVLWLFTGNGISFIGDFATRVLPININPQMENPDVRVFKRQDITRWVIDNRKHIMSAIISLIMSGKGIKENGSGSRFPLWNKFVRLPLLEITGVDILDATKRNQEFDTQTSSKRLLLSAIRDVYDSQPFTTKELIKSAYGSFESGETPLGDALEQFAGDKAKNVLSVGRMFAAMSGSVHGEHVLCRDRSLNNKTRWKVTTVEEAIELV